MRRILGSTDNTHLVGCRGKKRWIMGVPAKGEIWVDAGAVRAVRDARKSLFSAGITKVTALHSACRSGRYPITAGSYVRIA